jgi:hypothetical protein
MFLLFIYSLNSENYKASCFYLALLAGFNLGMLK